MFSTEEKERANNVFQLCVVLPSIRMLRAYRVKERRNFSPDEFCILLFIPKETKDLHLCQTSVEASLQVSSETLFEGVEVSTESVQCTIADLFMSVVRFESILKGASSDYLQLRHRPKQEDINEIMVLMYLLVYRISSLVMTDCMDFFRHFSIAKVLNIVSYLLREQTPQLFYITACSTFEENFVEKSVYGPFLMALSRLKALRIYLREEKRRLKKSAKKVTVPVYMNVLNRPKRAPIDPPPTPDDAAGKTTPRKVPMSTYVQPPIEDKLASLRLLNKMQALDLLDEAKRCAPSCGQIVRRANESENLQVRMSSELPAKGRTDKPPPTTYQVVDIKQNTTSILRECARIADEEMKEMNKLNAILEGGFDPSFVEKLEEERRQREKLEEMNKIEEKRLTVLLAREAAFMAKRSFLQNNKLQGETIRKEKQELYEKLQKLRTERDKEIADVAEKCREAEQLWREAYDCMLKQKRIQASQVSVESRQLKVELTRKREEERKRNAALIRELRAIQEIAKQRAQAKEFDSTETSGLGLLCEMSLAELRERLSLLKKELEKEANSRRDRVQRERERQKNLVKYSQMALHAYKADKRATWLEKRSSSCERPVVTSSPQVEALRQKLIEQRALRMEK